MTTYYLDRQIKLLKQGVKNNTITLDGKEALSEYISIKEQLTIPVVVDTLVCDIVKGTRCKDSFANYRDGVCYVCGGQAN
jgi:hypothetical protein